MIYTLKEGIRGNKLEFSNLISIDLNWVYAYNPFVSFEFGYIDYLIKDNIKFLSGNFSLCELRDDTIIPICIATNGVSNEAYTTDTPINILIDKTYLDKNDEISKFTKEHIKEHKNYKVTFVNNLSKHIFENFKIPTFNTIKDMKDWLNDVKVKWLKNERKKIKKEESLV